MIYLIDDFQFPYCVILNEVKNLNTSTLCFQILRVAQDDTIGECF